MLSQEEEEVYSVLERGVQVSCDWWTPGHVTTLLTLIGPGGAAPHPAHHPDGRAQEEGWLPRHRARHRRVRIRHLP